MLFKTNATKPPNKERQTTAKLVEQNLKSTSQGLYTGINKPLTPTNINTVKSPTTTASTIPTKQARAGRPGNYQKAGAKSSAVASSKQNQLLKNFLGLSTTKQQRQPINTNAFKPATSTKTFATVLKQAQQGKGNNYLKSLTNPPTTSSNKSNAQPPKNFQGSSTKRQEQRPISTNLVKPKTIYSTSSVKANQPVIARDRSGPAILTRSQTATINAIKQPLKKTLGLLSLMQKPLYGWSKYRKGYGNTARLSALDYSASGRLFNNDGIGKSRSGLKRGWGKYYQSTINPSQNAYTADSQFLSQASNMRRGWSNRKSSSLSYANGQPTISIKDACNICGCANDTCWHY